MDEILTKIRKFRDERDWMQFHNPKDLAISIVIEAAELLEQFQWKDRGEVEKHIKANREDISDEIADIAIYLAELSDNLGIDLKQAMERKLEKNAKKYPIEKARGVATKYTKL
ncbi:MAG: nucleotide pyrophosphohydrolase [Elusimicrobia bacterium]|nr:nucleotide pyrophosphohydrolase [Elusimicrobiota bacterium]